MEKTKLEICSQYYSQYYMTIIGVAGQLVFYGQAYKIFVYRSAHDVSLLGFTFGFISVASWLVYGLIKRDQPLIIANSVAVFGAMAVLIGIGMYG
jgi:MtN3 and saliva related transmembrane protein